MAFFSSFSRPFQERYIEGNSNFINLKGIQELVELNGKCQYDLYKLIAWCTEITSNCIQHNYYSVTVKNCIRSCSSSL